MAKRGKTEKFWNGIEPQQKERLLKEAGTQVEPELLQKSFRYLPLPLRNTIRIHYRSKWNHELGLKPPRKRRKKSAKEYWDSLQEKSRMRLLLEIPKTQLLVKKTYHLLPTRARKMVVEQFYKDVKTH